MRLEYPLLLLAFIALIVPIIIHLYNWRKFRKIQFPDISLLEELSIETTRFAKIKNWKLLITRLLLLSILILAFAKPFFPKNEKENTHTNIYLDNSESMNFGMGQKTKLEMAKEAAINLLKQIYPNQQIQIWTNNDFYEVTTTEEGINWINTLQATSSKKDIRELLDNKNNQASNWYIFSDFQKNTFIPDSVFTLINNKEININLIAFTDLPENNIYIDSVYFADQYLDQNKSNKAIIVIKNSINKGFETQLQLNQQGKPTAFKNIIASKQQFVDTLDLMLTKDEWQQLTWSIQDNSLNFDDTFRMSIKQEAAQTIQVYNNGANNNYLQAALQSFDKYQIINTPIQSLDSNIKSNFIILNNIDQITPQLAQNLDTWWQDGKDILFIPSDKLNTNSFNNYLNNSTGIKLVEWKEEQQSVFKVLHQHPIFANAIESISDQVTLPSSTKHLIIDANLKGNPINLMTYRNGLPFLSQYKIKNGSFNIISSPLNPAYSNFGTSDFFAPYLYNLAIQSNGHDHYTAYIGQASPIAVPNSGQSIWKIQYEDYNIVPEQKTLGKWVQIFLPKSLTHPGLYQLHNDNNDKKVNLAVNANKTESILNFANKQEINQLFAHPENINWTTDWQHIAKLDQQNAIDWWKILMVIALCLLSLEIYWAVFKRN